MDINLEPSFGPLPTFHHDAKLNGGPFQAAPTQTSPCRLGVVCQCAGRPARSRGCKSPTMKE